MTKGFKALALIALIAPFGVNATSLVLEPCADWTAHNPDFGPQPWLGQTCIDAVIDLHVGDARYDVRFLTDEGVQDSDFWPAAEAQARALALFDAFGFAPKDGDGNVWLTTSDGFTIPSPYADVPITPIQVAPDGWDADVWRVYGNSVGVGGEIWQLPLVAGAETYARFSVHVLEPGTLALLGLGLLGLGLTRRRDANCAGPTRL